MKEIQPTSPASSAKPTGKLMDYLVNEQKKEKRLNSIWPEIAALIFYQLLKIKEEFAPICHIAIVKRPNNTILGQIIVKRSSLQDCFNKSFETLKAEITERANKLMLPCLDKISVQHNLPLSLALDITATKG